MCSKYLMAADLNGYWQQRADYEMEITLHDSIKQITGTTILKYTNNSPDTLERIYLHLYPNAFQVGSVKYREYVGNAGRVSRAKYFKDQLDGFTSKIDIHDFSIALPKQGQSWIHKTPILSNYKIDDTILEAHLLKHIAPGETARIDLRWTHHVGEMVERAGLYEGQYNMAQWYPKIAVYDENGWHSDVFHAEGEFYGEFGDFKVKFDLPKAFIIASTGVVIDGDPGWNDVEVDTTLDYDIWLDIHNSTNMEMQEDERRVVTFLAENVHDFAWVASRDLLYEGGLSRDSKTKIHVLYDKDRGEDWTKVVLERSINALDWLETKFGDYPYPQITTVDRIKNGGMEYPMLVMNGRDSESLIVHEYGHVYFYGIIANNELDEAWLDEGLTTNQTTDYMMKKYGDHGFDIKLYEDYHTFPRKLYPLENDLHADQWSVIRYLRSGHNENISRPSYLFNSGMSYRRNAYTKPSLMLFELKYILGDSLFYSAMQHYYSKWKLKHVNEDRFIHAIQEHVNLDLTWFFEQWLHTTKNLDYSISHFKKEQNKDSSWDIELGIKSTGNRFMPMLIETTYEDGSKDRRWWKNHLWRYQDTLRYSVKNKPIHVVLDPDVQTVDLDYRNNTTRMKKKILFRWPGSWYKPRDKIVYWWQPKFYYDHSNLDLAPGIKVEREYGTYEKTIIEPYYASNSKKLYWLFSSKHEFVHYFPRTSFLFWGFDRPGVKEFGAEIEKKWDRVYGTTPTHTITGGFYIQPSYDGERSTILGFDPSGKLAVGYLGWKLKQGSLSHSLNGASSISPYSTWNFNRITFESNFSFKKVLGIENRKRPHLNRNVAINFRERLVVGKIWTDNSGVPGQEGFNIEGNSSNDMLGKNYLVDTFYGNDNLFSHYHLPGEGNIRGFVGKKEKGAEALIASSTEAAIFKNLAGTNQEPINIEIVSFTDVGVFWDRHNENTNQLETKFSKRFLADAGFGFQLETTLLGKNLFIRFDIPYYLYNGSESSIDWNNWVFSFQKSL